jgi:signal transduction histidine kinase
MNFRFPRSPWSILLAQSASYLLVIIIMSVTFGVFFATAKSHLELEVGKRLQDTSNIAARNAPLDRLALIKVGDDETRMVLRLKEKLNEIREATGVKNIFIFRPNQSSLLDLAPGKAIGSVYRLAHFDRKYLAELRQGRSVSTGSYRASSGALYISAYTPIMDENNRLFAVVAVDAGTKEIEVIDQMRANFVFIAGVGVLLAVALSLVLARHLTNPIRDMAATAESIGRGDYGARVEPPSTRELKALAGSINRMAEQVASRDAKLKELSASVAHEIRNPLNSIKLLITLLDEELEGRTNKTQKATIATLHQEISKLTRFLSEFLTYSKPVVLNRDEVSPLDLIRRVVDLSAAEAQERQVRLSLDADEDLPLIRVDRDRLEQSLLNIVLNAVDAANRRGTVRLSVRRSPDDGGLDFVVDDTGPGIEPEMRERVFEPFFTTRDCGTGLGLSNARKIVTGHGGQIRITDAPGGGARFVIHLPQDVVMLEES